MTTPVSLFSDSRPVADHETTSGQGQERNANGSSQREFASLMERALDTAPSQAHPSPARKEANKPSHALSPRTVPGKGKGRGGLLAGKPQGDLEGCVSARSTDSSETDEMVAKRSAVPTVAQGSSDDARLAQESEEGDATEVEPQPGLRGAACVGEALAPNIIVLPPPTVIVPFPMTLAAEEVDARGSVDSAGREAPNAESPLSGVVLGGGDKIISFAAVPAVVGNAERRAVITEGAFSALGARDSALEQGGVEVTRLQMLPVEVEEEDSRENNSRENIQVVDFSGRAEEKIIRLPLAAPASAERGARSGESGDVALRAAMARPEEGASRESRALSQLPGHGGVRVDFAGPAAADGLVAEVPVVPKGFTKRPVHAGLPVAQGAGAVSTEGTGISAAKQVGGMDLAKHSEQGSPFLGTGESGAEEFPPAGDAARSELKVVDFSPRVPGAMDWQLGRPVGSFDRPSQSPPVVLSPEQAATVERISNLMRTETSLVRQHSSDSMAVVLRPDDGTELYVHFAQRNGQIEATVRCDRGDVHQLGVLWPQLQESLAQQRVRLAPLQEGASANADFNHSTSFGSPGEGGGSQRHAPSDRQSMDERSAPASSIPDVSHVRGRGGSRRRLTTSRPGWETWA